MGVLAIPVSIITVLGWLEYRNFREQLDWDRFNFVAGFVVFLIIWIFFIKLMITL